MAAIISILSAGAQLVQLVPSFLKMFGRESPPPAVVNKAIEIAQSITGTSTAEDALIKVNTDPELMLKYKDAAEARAVDVMKMYLQDMGDARARDVAIQTARGRNYRADAMVALTVTGMVVLVVVAVSISGLSEFAKGIVNIVIGALIANWNAQNNFEFGTTRQNKVKDDTINDLTKQNG